MALLCIETIPSGLVDRYFKKVHEKLHEKDLVRNAFTGGVKKFGGGLYGVHMRPIYPPVYIIGLLYVVVFLFFNRFQWSWWLLPGIIVGLTGVFYSAWFFYTMLYFGLRKLGYEGKIHFLTCSQFMRRLV